MSLLLVIARFGFLIYDLFAAQSSLLTVTVIDSDLNTGQVMDIRNLNVSVLEVRLCSLCHV